MGILQTLTEALAASTGTPGEGGSAGAYWCHDCDERVPAGEITDEPPACPACGAAMTFERSPGTAGCAC